MLTFPVCVKMLGIENKNERNKMLCRLNINVQLDGH